MKRAKSANKKVRQTRRIRVHGEGIEVNYAQLRQDARSGFNKIALYYKERKIRAAAKAKLDQERLDKEFRDAEAFYEKRLHGPIDPKTGKFKGFRVG